MKKSLKKQLEALNMPQVQIADAIGCNRSYFSKIWNGHTPLSERFSERLVKLIADPSYQFGRGRKVLLKEVTANIQPVKAQYFDGGWHYYTDKNYTDSLSELGSLPEQAPISEPKNDTKGKTTPPIGISEDDLIELAQNSKNYGEQIHPAVKQKDTTSAYTDSLLSDLALAQKAIGALYLENIKLQNGSGKN